MKYRLIAISMIITMAVCVPAYAETQPDSSINETAAQTEAVLNANDDSSERTAENTGIFSDVPSDAWYAEAVDFVAKRKIMNGTSSTEFSPYSDATRGMLAVVIKNMDGTSEKAYWSYLDVNEDAWYADSVAWCSENDILKGYGGGMFGPEDSITREQLISTLYRFAEYKGFSNMETNGVELLEYKDYADISGYAGGPMQWALKNNIMSGRDGRLEPKGVASRAEIAQILRNFMVFYNM